MTQSTAYPKLYIGIDVHKSNWKVNIYTDLSAGKTFTMPPKAELVKSYVDKHFPDSEQVRSDAEKGL